jgi:transmembrane sensor
MTDDINWQLLDRFLAGECTPPERREMLRWLATHPAPRQYVDALREAMALPSLESPGVQPGRRRFAALGAPLIRVAAVLALLVGGVAVWWAGTRRLPAAPAMQEFASAARQRLNLRLSDGTRVLLAPETRLRVASDFGTHRRDLYVEGEAYFEVAHDSTRPFTVFAANASTRDVGTVFAVRSYPDEHAVRVVVREGTVAMSGAGMLAAGDVGRLTAQGRASVRRQANVTALLSWVEGGLAFEDAPLRQVLADLRRWYGVDAVVADPGLAALPFTGSLRHAPPTDALQLVAAALGLRVREVGTRVVLERS